MSFFKKKFKLLMSKEYERAQVGKIIYELDKENSTASIVGQDDATEEYVPRSIIIEGKEYEITRISPYAFEKSRLTKIKFSPDSKIQSIGEKAFFISLIEQLTIPASVSELEPGWCCYMSQLQSIKVDSNNLNYKTDDENRNLILGKSDIFDTLVFAISDFSSVVIPPYVKRIGPYTFSNLKIQRIKIPPNVTEICEFAFNGCRDLESFVFSEDSQIRSIGQGTFSGTRIQKLTIPQSCCELKEGWCKNGYRLIEVTIMPNNKRYKNIDMMVVGKSDINNDVFDDLEFVSRKASEVSIPPNIKRIKPFAFQGTSIQSIEIPQQVIKICEGSFHYCESLSEVKIPLNSELRKIGSYAFYRTKIKYFFVTRHITEIGKRAFLDCEQLRVVEIPNDSELEIIGSKAFSDTLIENLTIPSTVCELKDGWCDKTAHLTNVTVMPNNKFYKNYEYDDSLIVGKSDINSDIFDVLVFASRKIDDVVSPPDIKIISPSAFRESAIRCILIPPKVVEIGKYSFAKCKYLQFVEIPTDSNLQKIGKSAFRETSIENIFLPYHITEIGRFAFSKCWELQNVEISLNSQIKIISKEAFSITSIKKINIANQVTEICDHAFENSKIKYISLPKSVRIIGQYAFSRCRELKKIDIHPDSNLREIRRLDLNTHILIEFLFLDMLD